MKEIRILSPEKLQEVRIHTHPQRKGPRQRFCARHDGEAAHKQTDSDTNTTHLLTSMATDVSYEPEKLGYQAELSGLQEITDARTIDEFHG